jgi:hypothetical protein
VHDVGRIVAGRAHIDARTVAHGDFNPHRH